MIIEKINDHVDKAKERLPRFLDGAVNFNSLIEIFASRTQDLETELFNLLDERYLTVATGAQLDGIGQIVDLKRNVGQIDSDYRLDLIAETGKLALSGQIESLILLFRTLTFAPDSDLIEFFPASVVLTAFSDSDPEDPIIDQKVIDSMNEVKAAGVSLDLRFAEESSRLEFSRFSDTDINGNGPIVSDRGLGSVSLPDGGGLARLIR